MRRAITTLPLSCGHECILYTDTPEGETVHCPVCGAQSIVDLSLPVNSGRPALATRPRPSLPTSNALALAKAQGLTLDHRGNVSGGVVRHV